jgi:hypothetical protein
MPRFYCGFNDLKRIDRLRNCLPALPALFTVFLEGIQHARLLTFRGRCNATFRLVIGPDRTVLHHPPVDRLQNASIADANSAVLFGIIENLMIEETLSGVNIKPEKEVTIDSKIHNKTS